MPATAEIHSSADRSDGEVEFITTMWFDSLDAVKAFAGENYEGGLRAPKARDVLARFDSRSQHYEIRERIDS